MSREKQMQALADEINKLEPHARLRLAADLLEQRRPHLAHAIANKVVTELGAVLAMRALAEARGR